MAEISLLAAGHKTFRDRLQFLPACADLFGLCRGDLAVGGGGGDDGEEVGEFLDDLVGGRNQKMRMRRVLGVEDEKAAGTLANPLDKPVVAGALQQRFDAVERVAGAAAGGVVRRLGPFIDHRKRQAEIGGDLFGGFFVENLAQQFIGMHDGTMEKRGGSVKPKNRSSKSEYRRLNSAAFGGCSIVRNSPNEYNLHSDFGFRASFGFRIWPGHLKAGLRAFTNLMRNYRCRFARPGV